MGDVEVVTVQLPLSLSTAARLMLLCDLAWPGARLTEPAGDTMSILIDRDAAPVPALARLLEGIDDDGDLGFASTRELLEELVERIGHLWVSVPGPFLATVRHLLEDDVDAVDLDERRIRPVVDTSPL